MLALSTIMFVNTAVNHAVRPCEEVRRHAVTCGLAYRPALVGDCKQYAAMKLRELILAGAQPDEFVMWVVQVPGRRSRHMVLVHRPTGLVLDNLINLVEPRELKERYEGYAFLRPCEDCGEEARVEAAAILSERARLGAEVELQARFRPAQLHQPS